MAPRDSDILVLTYPVNDSFIQFECQYRSGAKIPEEVTLVEKSVVGRTYSMNYETCLSGFQISFHSIETSQACDTPDTQFIAIHLQH